MWPEDPEQWNAVNIVIILHAFKLLGFVHPAYAADRYKELNRIYNKQNAG